ncbi:uncharacterized protein MYCGRDRAFT_95804 [Zymoseptoria tritici IPO323]|uniref:Uncharacterized protein n=1 Tax=Zymoseptoria tritici (strain CBS 115943 / IPO323) TaxID=336722 RepID=F9XJA4_ZYMTI|nr:uncharacterized protein MYCGRDRAFT_95804 [Zymoseptoria tritici IPO323]EGP84639.1 hypothetical protein MYCGRDRAFT_95804 [Zymoseptoria tritici IPO323]
MSNALTAVILSPRRNRKLLDISDETSPPSKTRLGARDLFRSLTIEAADIWELHPTLYLELLPQFPRELDFDAIPRSDGIVCGRLGCEGHRNPDESLGATAVGTSLPLQSARGRRARRVDQALPRSNVS